MELIDRLYAAVQEANLQGLEAVVDPDWVEDPPAYSGQPKGAKGYLPVAQELRKALGGLRIEILEVIDAAPKYVVRTRLSGKHQDTFLNVPATGKDIRFDAIDIHEVVDGKIQRTWHIKDFAGAMRQMRGG